MLSERLDRAAETPAGFSVPPGHEGVFSFDLKDVRDHLKEVVGMLRSLKAHIQSIPEVVFVGGLPDQSFLVAFTRSLGPKDFEKLWTMKSAPS
jgi:hypothetical protein